MSDKNYNKLDKIFDHNYKLINYFQRDITRFKILIIIIKNYHNNKLQTIEEVIDQIPKSLSSRAHKLNFITEATNNNYFIKENANSDMRKKYLKPSKLLLDEFELYLQSIV